MELPPRVSRDELKAGEEAAFRVLYPALLEAIREIPECSPWAKVYTNLERSAANLVPGLAELAEQARQARCAALTVRGDRCKNAAASGTLFCRRHRRKHSDEAADRRPQPGAHRLRLVTSMNGEGA